MLQKLFSIYADGWERGGRLTIELGRRYLSVVLLDSGSSDILAFELISWKEGVFFDENIWTLVKESLAVLGLHKFMLVSLIDAQSDGLALIENEFPNALTKDKEACLHRHLDINQQEKLQMHLMYLPSACCLSAVLNGEIKAIQWISFEQPLDVVYYLVNATHLLLGDNDMHNVDVWIAGMIDQSSVLYQELDKFIPHLFFENRGLSYADTAAFAAMPAHYFVPFLKYI